MSYKSILFVFLCFISMILGAPGAPRANPNCMMALEDCQLDSGPVCAIDASGLPQTFENKCMALFESCRRDTFFVEVKPGEC